jgi:thiol-disulfide isomerase/thioredoxin
MEKSYLFLVLLLLSGCKKNADNQITVIGHLNGNKTKEISLISDNLIHKAQVDNNGDFVIRFKSTQARIYEIPFNDKLYLFLIPSDSLIITRDSADYKFSGGQSAVLSKYYQDWQVYWKYLVSSFSEQKYFSLEPDDFSRTVYAYLDSSEYPLINLKKTVSNINPEFLKLEQERLKYWMIVDFLPYEYQMHQFYTGKVPVTEEWFHNYMNDVNLSDTSLLQLDYYKDFLVAYTRNVAESRFQKNTVSKEDRIGETNFMIDFILNEFKNEKILNYVLYSVIMDRTNNLLVNDENLASFKKHCSNEKYIKEVEDRYKDLSGLMQGKPAPEFTLYDVNDKEYKISDFKGKYLLLDVWGVYCNPCLREMPKVKEIKAAFRDANINIVQVNLDATKEMWTKKIGELNLDGIQLMANKGWQSEFKKAYKIDVIPTFILIDKDGNFFAARTKLPTQNLENVLNNLPDIRN